MTAPADFVAIGAASNPSFSTDGQSLFHLRGSSLPQIWRMDLAGGSAEPLTAHDEKIAFLRRAPKDDRIVYGIDAGGDERQQFWLLEGGASRSLTASPDVIHDFGAWSPDGTRIAYTANDRDPAHFDVLVMEVATGTARRLMHGTHLLSVSSWSPAGDRLVAVADHAFGEQTLWIIPTSAEAGATAHPVPTPALTRWASVRWASDGGSLLGLTDLGGHDHMRLARIDPASGGVTWLYAAPDGDVEAWSLSTDGHHLATIENAAGAAVLRVGDLAEERPVPAGLPDGRGAGGMVGDLAWAPGGHSLAFAASSAVDPAGVFLWEVGAAARPVWRPDPLAEAGIDPASLTPFAAVAWDSFDGARVSGWLALPTGPRRPGGCPAVIWVHGGPASQARANFRPDMQMLLSQGYAVLMPNVRGSTGQGRAWTESDDVGQRLDSVADLAHAHRFMVAQPGIDPARIAVMGQSYGGYMVLAAITEYPLLFAAAIDYYGIADFANLLAQTGPWRRRHRATEYGDPVADAALFERISPVRHAAQVQTPLLVLHGARDPRVPIGQSEQIVEALRLRQAAVRYQTFDYAGHGFFRAADHIRAVELVADFLREHVGP